MDNFQKKFIEEATDLINSLEESLLQLDKTPENQELVETIFRALHSLKGSGAMFGFEAISKLTHNLETIYDFVRNKKVKITKLLLDTTLSAVDYLKLLLNKENFENQEIQKGYLALENKISKLIEDIRLNLSKTELQTTEINNTVSTYYISFRPFLHIFNNGVNPLYLVDELHTLGTCKVFSNTSKLPSLGDYEPVNCYTFWNIFLVTDKPVIDIQDVFLFVEDESDVEITKISSSNLLINNDFLKYINIFDSQVSVSVEQIIDYVDSLKFNKPKSTDRAFDEKIKLFSKENTITSVRVDAEKLDILMNLVSELVTTQARLNLVASKHQVHELTLIAENISFLTRQLRDNSFSMSLVPVDSVLIRFHRLVRDLSKEFNKEINFVSEGSETELDKNIIQSLTEPLMHILRNSIDHGIESREKRRDLGKPDHGTILFKTFYSGTHVIIEINDDGAGIDPEKIRKRAIEKKIITSENKLTEKELINLIFQPGLSTAQKITGVSGRGVGMDVVKRRISDIRGEVEVNSKLNTGTSIRIKLPLTLSIIDGLLVKINKTNFVIPLSVIDKIYPVEHHKLAGSFNNILVLNGEQVPYYYLRDEFNISSDVPDTEHVVVVRYENKRIGLAVDVVVGEYQAVLKPLGKYYTKQEMIAGATILGDGTVALVVDTNKIINKFSQTKFTNQ